MIRTIARAAALMDGTEDHEAGHDAHRRLLRRTSAVPSPDRTRHLYDDVSRGYARYRDRWLALAGDDADTAMLDDLAGAPRPGQRVLDAGSGTGVISRRVLRLCPDVRLAMLDPSPGILDQAAGVGAPRINAGIVEPSFPDATFDVVAVWVVETVAVTRVAVAERFRVFGPGGRLLCNFCSQPTDWSSRLCSLPLRRIVRWGLAGRFVDSRRTPWHECAALHRRRFHCGVVTEIALRRRCTVGATDVPEAAGPLADGVSRGYAAREAGCERDAIRARPGRVPQRSRRLGQRWSR